VDKAWRLRWRNPSPLTQTFPPATTLSFSNRPFLNYYPLLFVIPSEAEGSAVLRTIPGNVFRHHSLASAITS